MEAAQLKMVAMLKAHLQVIFTIISSKCYFFAKCVLLFQSKLGHVEGVVAVSNLIVSLQDLRRLAEILTGEENVKHRKQNDDDDGKQ